MIPDPATGLDPKHALFVDKYFELTFNATKAAIAAGYSRRSARQQGSRLLTKDDIKAEVERRFAEQVMSKSEVLARLADHARGDIRDLATVETAKQLARHPNGNLVKEFERTVTTTYLADEKKAVEEKIKLKLYDAQAAQVQIGRHHKLFTDNMDMTTGGDKLTSPQVFLPAVEPDDE